MSEPASEHSSIQISTASSSSMPPPSPTVLAAWLEQSRDLLALTDDDGVIVWSNIGFSSVTGLAHPQTLLDLAPADWQGGHAHDLLLRVANGTRADEPELCLRGPTGEALRLSLCMTVIGAQRLWTFQDTSAQYALEARARRLSELLDMAQEFGRLGVWERQVPSGVGRWDRHVFKFFGMDPSEGTPDYEQASQRMHPADRKNQIFMESIRKPGRYSNRYRIVHADGSLRWIHSQWEVKASATGVPDRTIGIMVDDTETYEMARSLNAATAHLSLAAELGNIIIWRHELKTDRVQYNARGYQFIGIEARAEGMSTDDIRDVMHRDDLASVEASAALALQIDHPVDETARYRRHDGVWRTLLSRRVVERDTAGKPVAFVGVSLDITEQAEQTRQMQQLAQRLEAAARAGRMGIWSAMPDSGETEWNAQMFELFDRIDGPTPPMLRDWLRLCVHRDDAARVGEAINLHLLGREGAFEIEFRIHTRDDQIRWIVLRADIDRAADERQRIFGVAMDVTDQHAVRNALRAASQRTSLIAHHAGIGTWETDELGGQTLWDEQMFRLRGLAPRSTALSRNERLALLHPDDRGTTLDADPIANAQAPAMAYEFRVLWPDASVHWLASRSAPLHDEAGKVIRRMGVNWDITESKNAQLAQQQAQLAERESQAKSRFLSRMSHELRTPLNAVLGFTQLLQADARKAAAGDQLTKLNHIRTAGEHLLALINDALDLSSLESGTLKLDLRPVAIEQALVRALPLLDALAASKQVKVKRGTVHGVVLADAARLHQVLANLLGNAIKNNRENSEVEVSSQAYAAHVTLQVVDRGRSLRAEQLAHLFEPFNHLGVESEGIESSGIGLTIARAMVESMGGEISVISDAQIGTVFELSLPSAAISANTATWPELAPKANASPTLPQRHGCLLYIEDNEVNVLLVEELVRSISGLRFIAAATGEAGVATALQQQPDVILVDLQLPDFDGFEVLRRLRAQPATAHMLCIALSANAMPDDIERGRAAGFDDYWTKPIRLKPFLDGLKRIFPLDKPSITTR